MKILIAYGTTEGQTRKVAETISTQIERLGHEVELFDTANPQKDLKIGSFDKIILAGSVHQKDYQESLKLFIEANLPVLNNKQTMLISVSLASAFDDRQEEAKGYTSKLSERPGWNPTKILLVAGAIIYDEYDYFKEQIIKHIALQGRSVDVKEGNQEFTDWSELAANVENFIST